MICNYTRQHKILFSIPLILSLTIVALAAGCSESSDNGGDSGTTETTFVITPTIVGGGWHVLALRSDGTVWTWGFGSSGQLGDGNTSSSSTPVQVVDSNDSTGFLTEVIAVAGGDEHSLALKEDGTVWAWGAGSSGQLGNGLSTMSSTPVQPVDANDSTGYLTGVSAISAFGYHSTALKTDGTVWSWGDNTDGLLGDGYVVNDSSFPIPACASDATTPCTASNANILTGVAQVSTGYYHTVVLKTDGTVWAWGSNSYGELSIAVASPFQESLPVRLLDASDTSGYLSGVSEVISGTWHTLILKTDGSVIGYGDNVSGELGNGTASATATPVVTCAIAGCTGSLTGVVQIATASDHTIGLMDDGTVTVWGSNYAGDLGDGTTTQRNSPQAVSGIVDVIAVATSLYDTTYVLLSDGAVWAWGSNNNDQLGYTTTDMCNGRACSTAPAQSGTIDLLP